MKSAGSSSERELLERLERLFAEVNEVIEALACLRSPDGAGSDMLSPHGFSAMLKREVQRSQRCNHYCVAALVPVTGQGVAGFIKAGLACFRETDVLGLLEGGIGESDGGAGIRPVYLGILLPETDREGGQVAVRRAARVLQPETGRYGLAACPDDATSASDLLKRAMRGMN